MEPPARHRPQRRRGHVQRPPLGRARVLAQQEQQLRGARELRRAAEPAVRRVERLLELRDAGGQRVRSGHCAAGFVAGTRAALLLGEPLHQRLRGLHQLGPPFGPELRDVAQDVGEPRPAPARGGRKVRAAVERLELRRQPDAQRPAAGAGRGLDERHVHPVHVGPLFAVDLDRHEIPVQQLGHLAVLERLALHDVAPVARRVADRQEDRPVVRPRQRERLRSPGVPLDRVFGVLQEIGARLLREAVWHYLVGATRFRAMRGTNRASGPRGRTPRGASVRARSGIPRD